MWLLGAYVIAFIVSVVVMFLLVHAFHDFRCRCNRHEGSWPHWANASLSIVFIGIGYGMVSWQIESAFFGITKKHPSTLRLWRIAQDEKSKIFHSIVE
ncbi:MAG: hypothetical protein O2904_02020 [bacterium]|nr:hypothetical protein [bacterium]